MVSQYCTGMINNSFSHFCLVCSLSCCPGHWSNEDNLPGWLCMSPSVAMATHYFPKFLIVLFLSSVTLLYLVTVTPSPSSPSSLPLPWPSPSCGVGQSWAVRLRTGPYYEEKGGEEVALQLDVVANRVKHINIFDFMVLQNFTISDL